MRVISGVRSRLLGVGLAAALIAVPASARADEVTFAGFTRAGFNGAAPAGGAVLNGLIFNAQNFSGTTSSGFLALGSDPGTMNNLGSLLLTGAPANYNGNTFTLQVTFTLPAGISGAQNPLTFNALVTGSVTSINNGGVLIDFTTGPQTVTFSSGGTTGSFTFSVNDVSVNPGKEVAITGQIISATQTTIPEPASMTLLATGLAGLGAAARRRKNAK